MDQVFPGFPELGIFFGMLLLIKAVFPEETIIGVGEVRTLAVKAFEQMRAEFTLLGFELRWINFVVSFATLCKITVVLS